MNEDDPLPKLIAYARTSTADQQNPKESLRWQLDAARTLTASRAEIVEVVHDKDTTRSLPWSQRKEAAGLLKQLANPARGWSGIVVGEPQRAFGDTGQVQTVLAQLNHYGVQLWVPELAGPVDPNSEIHDIILSLFGGLSRAERNRLRIRVRTAMRAMAPEGRYLGGRPPYGYEIVRTGVAHPNPEKARQGIELTRLAVNPETAPVVRQIFQWRGQGLGYRAIASRLTDSGVPCPSAADRERNPHRLGRAWAVGAVRAIIINPKYKGNQVYGRYHKVERLRSVDNPSAGHVTREVPSTPTEILAFDELTEPIVTEAEWQAAQPETCTTRPGPRPDSPTTKPKPSGPPSSGYALRGLMTCGICGKRMQSNVIRRKNAEPRVGYRCHYRYEYPGDAEHPKSLFVAESRIIPVLDKWLGDLSSTRVEELVKSMMEEVPLDSSEPPEIHRARLLADEARSKLTRYMDAIEKGMDPTLYVERSRAAQSELAAAEAVLADHSLPTEQPITEDEIRALLEQLGSVVDLLDGAAGADRRTFYNELGLRLSYHRVDHREKVRVALGVGQFRVGGGT